MGKFFKKMKFLTIFLKISERFFFKAYPKFQKLRVNKKRENQLRKLSKMRFILKLTEFFKKVGVSKTNFWLKYVKISDF